MFDGLRAPQLLAAIVGLHDNGLQRVLVHAVPGIWTHDLDVDLRLQESLIIGQGGGIAVADGPQGSLPRVDGDTPARAIYRQLDVGLDFVNDGEFSRSSYAGEILDSMTGFEDNVCTGPLPRS